MKRILFLLLFLMLSVICFSQNRTVKGYVLDKDHKPIPGVVLNPYGSTEKYPVNSPDGSFSILISYDHKQLTAFCDGYIPVTKVIDGSFLAFILEVDMAAVRAKQEAEARVKAEAEAKARAEEAARIKTENERKAAEAKAKAEAEAKAKAEEEARIMADKNEAYDKRFKNNGWQHSIDLSYSYHLEECRIIYRYSGYRDYKSLNPLELDYAAYFSLNRLFAVGAGTGILFNAKSITIRNDSFISTYGKFKERRWDIPVFAAMKYTPTFWQFRPLIGAALGLYSRSQTVLWEFDLGGEYRLSKESALHLCLSFKALPYPSCNETKRSYSSTPSVSAKIGYAF